MFYNPRAIVALMIYLKVLLSYGDRFFVKICEQEVIRLPPFEDSSSPVYHGPYIVSFQQNNRVRMIGLFTERAARAVYDVISADGAKVMLDERRPEVDFCYK